MKPMQKTMLCIAITLASCCETVFAGHPWQTATTVNGKIGRLFLLAGGWEQLMPRAVKPLFEAYSSCNQDIHLSCLNPLECSNV